MSSKKYNNKKKNTKNEKSTKEDESKDEGLLSALNMFLKEKEGVLKQQEKENEESRRLKKIQDETLNEAAKLKSEGKFNEMYEMLLKELKYNYDITSINAQLIEKNNTLTSKDKSLGQAKESLIQHTNERQAIINNEKAKREELAKRCDDFIKDIEAKYTNQLPDLEDIRKENEMLKSKYEEYVQNTSSITDNLESQMKLKEEQTEKFETEFRSEINSKIEEMSKHSITLSQENEELKAKVKDYLSKFDDVNKTISKYNARFERLKADLEKRTKEVLKLKKDKLDMQQKHNITQQTINELKNKNELYGKEIEKATKQYNMMTSLSKNLQDQLAKQKELAAKLEESNK